MTSTKKVGLLGAGYISDSHADALKPLENVEITVVCDSSLGRAQALAQRHGIPHAVGSLEEMFELGVDAVHVLVPPNLHIDLSRKILDAGCHVLLEKPMGLDSKSCYELADYAEEKGLKLGVSHNFLFLPGYEQLYADVQSGVLGQLDQVTLHWFQMLPFLKFGPFDAWMLAEPKNLFFELGPHTVAFMLDLLGPLDDFNVKVSRPIDLPGNKRAYRRWQMFGTRGDVALDLNMSLVPGYNDMSVAVRGSSGTGKFDFGRDLYFQDMPTRHSMVWDYYFSARNTGKQIIQRSRKNLINNVINTLKKSPASTPFGLSIGRSVETFYDGLDKVELDRRLDARFGAQIIEWCEKVTDKAEFEPVEDTSRVWEVLPPKEKPTVLVIGGTGFIGKYLVEKLVNRGYGVRVVTRNMNAGNIVLAGLPVELVQGSLKDPDFLDQAMEGIDTVYDLAKALGDTWDEYYQNDVLVTKNIAERALAAGVKRFVYTGTIDSFYSAKADDTITCETPLDQNIKHRNLYARSKKACEDLLMEKYEKEGLPLTIFRPGVVIGKGCPPAHWGVGKWESDNIVQFWGDGSNKLPLVLVEDVAEGLALAMDVEQEKILGKAFNLVDEPFINAQEYAKIVSDESGIQVTTLPTSTLQHFIADAMKNAAKIAIRHPKRQIPSYRDWDSRAHRAYYDCSITRDVLGWKPANSRERIVEDGVKASVQEMLS